MTSSHIFPLTLDPRQSMTLLSTFEALRTNTHQNVPIQLCMPPSIPARRLRSRDPVLSVPAWDHDFVNSLISDIVTFISVRRRGMDAIKPSTSWTPLRRCVDAITPHGYTRSF